MEILLIILLIVSFFALLVSSALRVPSSHLSTFELGRRKKLGDNTADRLLEVRRYSIAFQSLFWLIRAVLLVMFTGIAIITYDGASGIFLGVTAAIAHGFGSSSKLCRYAARRIFKKCEVRLLEFFHAHPTFVRRISFATSSEIGAEFGSLEDFHYSLKHADAIDQNTKTRLERSIDFSSKTAGNIMTPRNNIDSIKASELLGPLVLDDLHRTGHRCIPVADGSIDEIVGVLDIDRHFTLDGNKKHTSRVETVMDKNVQFVSVDEPLETIFSMSAKNGTTFFVVLDDQQKTAGILTLGDMLRALLGDTIKTR